MKKLTKEQMEALHSVVEYMGTTERNHLEECLCEETDEDVSDFTDDDLYGYCILNGFCTTHIWLKVYLLSKIIN
jgi:hypothetical protein